MQRNENRIGYKKTKVGWIPEEWESSRIGDIFEVASGSTPSRKKHDDYFLNGGIEWVKTTDLNNSEIYKTSERITEKGLKESSCKMLPINTVFVAMYGGFNQIGRTGLLKIEAACNQALSAILPTTDYSPEFLLAWLNSQVLYWKKLSASSRKDPNITKNDVHDFPLAIPPFPEQKAIAEVLECWDLGIKSLELKIGTKRQIKRGLMQRLLTGQTRLPGFGAECRIVNGELGIPAGWKNVRLGEITTPRKEKVDPQRSGTIDFCVELEHIESKTGTLLGYTSAGEHATLKTLFYKGDILFGKLRAYLEKCWLADRDGACSTEIWVFTPKTKRIAPNYLFQIIKSDPFISAANVTSGTHMPRSDWDVVKKLKIPLPPLEEQRAIADVLSTADEEIEALERKLTLWKDQKKFLLNNLVTGTIRVPEFSNHGKHGMARK